jgi:hypothetical protein
MACKSREIPYTTMFFVRFVAAFMVASLLEASAQTMLNSSAPTPNPTTFFPPECPALAEPCMNEENYQQCLDIVNEGCRRLLILKSCPLQFGCAPPPNAPLLPVSSGEVRIVLRSVAERMPVRVMSTYLRLCLDFFNSYFLVMDPPIIFTHGSFVRQAFLNDTRGGMLLRRELQQQDDLFPLETIVMFNGTTSLQQQMGSINEMLVSTFNANTADFIDRLHGTDDDVAELYLRSVNNVEAYNSNNDDISDPTNTSTTPNATPTTTAAPTVSPAIFDTFAPTETGTATPTVLPTPKPSMPTMTISDPPTTAESGTAPPSIPSTTPSTTDETPSAVAPTAPGSPVQDPTINIQPANTEAPTSAGLLLLRGSTTWGLVVMVIISLL